MNTPMNMPVPIRYPPLWAFLSACSIDIVTASPPVSPIVVAMILMIQKPSVTSGTLLNAAFIVSLMIAPFF